MYVRKLVKLGKTWSDDKKVIEFKKSVSDSDYDTEVRIHSGNFTELVEIVRKREQDLGHSALETSRNNKRTRRFKFGDDEKVSDEEEEPRKSKKKKKKNGDTPKGNDVYVQFMPKFVFATFNSDAKTNLGINGT